MIDGVVDVVYGKEKSPLHTNHMEESLIMLLTGDDVPSISSHWSQHVKQGLGTKKERPIIKIFKCTSMVMFDAITLYLNVCS